MTLRNRLARLEQHGAPAFVPVEAIDRPPQETREQWLARMAGNRLARVPRPANQTEIRYLIPMADRLVVRDGHKISRLLGDQGQYAMSARSWAEFMEIYYRPHPLVVKLGRPSDSASGRKLVCQLRQIIESLRSTADHAMLLGEHEVHIAFEREVDAVIAGELLGS